MADDWDDEDGGDDAWADEDGGDDAWVGGGDDDGFGDAAGDDGGVADSWEIQVENLYYTAEPDIKADPSVALDNFLACIDLEEKNSADKVTHRFNALKHVVMILFGLGAPRRTDMVAQYSKLLSISHLVSPNDLNNAIRSILNAIQESADKSSLEEMYSMTLDFFKQEKGKERVWFEFAMRLCKSYLDTKKMDKCQSLLDELHSSCKQGGDLNNEDDLSKGSQLLEIYAIRIQLVAATNNRVALTELFERTNKLAADVNDPRSMSVIKECYGKMHASMNQWDAAYVNFFDAFRSYQDIGHANVKQCLKYVVIASMLSDENTNPFASQEAGVFKSNSDMMPIVNLLDAFDNDDINNFENTLRRDKHAILNDDFIVEAMPAVKLKIRSKVLVKLIKPYTRVKLEWLCGQLNATIGEVENLVVNLILDGSVNGRLDGIHRLLDLNYNQEQDKLYGAMDNWLSAVNRLRNSIATRTGRQDIGGGRGMGMGGMHAFGGMMDFDVMDDDMYGSQFGIGDSDLLGWS